MIRIIILSAILIFFFSVNSFAQEKSNQKDIVILTNSGEKGKELEIRFQKGKSFDKPTFAFWIEDVDGKYIETLYVTNYLGTGIFKHSKLAEGKPFSKSGPAKRPSALPYWLHKRNIIADGSTYLPTPDKPVPDAITCATPQDNFTLKTVAKAKLSKKFRILMEINQPFDYNKFWKKDQYPGEFDYGYSAQPAVVYSVVVDQDSPQKEYVFSCNGHSHYSGKDGALSTDISTLTTALRIVKEVKVVLK